MKDNPDFLFVMTTEICCSFPLYDMLKYHVQNGNMITVLSTTIEEQNKNGAKNQNKKKQEDIGCFIMDDNTKEILHYT